MLLFDVWGIQQFEVKGPDLNGGEGYLMKPAQRKAEVDGAERFALQHLVASVGIIILTFFIRNKKSTTQKTDDILDH